MWKYFSEFCKKTPSSRSRAGKDCLICTRFIALVSFFYHHLRDSLTVPSVLSDRSMWLTLSRTFTRVCLSDRIVRCSRFRAVPTVGLSTDISTLSDRTVSLSQWFAFTWAVVIRVHQYTRLSVARGLMRPNSILCEHQLGCKWCKLILTLFVYGSKFEHKVQSVY